MAVGGGGIRVGGRPAPRGAHRKVAATVGLAVRERRAVTTPDLLSDSRIALTAEQRTLLERSVVIVEGLDLSVPPSGVYQFSGLAPGSYSVQVDTTSAALAGFVATAVNAGGSTAANDSNANPSSTNPTFLVSGGSDLTVDFGYYKPVTVGDLVRLFTFRQGNANLVEITLPAGSLAVDVIGQPPGGDQLHAHFEIPIKP